MKNDGFYFIPKQWLGDANIIAMDWDCKGMHLHLIAIAWQQDPKGHLIDDDNLILKLIGNPSKEDWENRIKKQIFSAWKSVVLEINGVERRYWCQPDIIKITENAEKPAPVRRTRKKKATGQIIENPLYEGFDLKSLLNNKVGTTILYEKATEQDKSDIWKLGVKLIQQQNESEAKVRGFIARLIKEYGEKPVANAIAQLSIKAVKPADINSYLIGILKKNNEDLDQQKKGTGRGRVSI